MLGWGASDLHAQAAPLFGVSPTSLSFGNVAVGSAAQLTFQVQASPRATFTQTLSVSSNDAAFTASPTSFNLAPSQSVTVTVRFAPPGTGDFSGIISVTELELKQTQTVDVSGVGVIAVDVSPDRLDLGGVLIGCRSTATFTVTTGAPVSIQVTSDHTAFSASPSSFDVSRSQAVIVTFTPRTAGQVAATLTVRATRSGQTVQTLTVEVTGLGSDVTLNPASLDFGAVAVGNQAVRNVGYTTTLPAPPALTLLRTSASSAYNARPGSAPGQIEVLFTPPAEGLFTDRLTLSLTLQAPGVPACDLNRILSVTGTGVQLRRLTASPSVVEFFARRGAPAEERRAVTITSSEPSDLPWRAQVTGNPTWLRITPSTGGVPGILVLDLDTSRLGPGVFDAEVVISPQLPASTPALRAALESPAQEVPPARVSVRVTVTDPPPKLSVLPPVLLLTAPPGSAAPLRRKLLITNQGAGPLRWTAEAETVGDLGWLSVTPISGETPAPASAIANPTGLRTGVYQGKIRVRSGSEQVAVPVVLVVSRPGPVLGVTPAGLLLEAIQGTDRTPVRRFRVFTTGSGPANWTADTFAISGGNWLLFAPSTGVSDPANLPGSPEVAVAANLSGLAPGVYGALVRVQSPQAVNGPLFVTIILNVIRPGAQSLLELEPGGLRFVGTVGVLLPAQTLEVRINSPQAVPFRAAATTLSGGSWLNITALNPTASTANPGQLRAQVNTRGMTPGDYRGLIGVALADGTVRAAEVLLQVTAAAPAAITAQKPGVVLQETCVPARLAVTNRALVANFSARAGWPSLIEVQVNDNCGANVDTASVVTTFSNGDPPVVLAGVGTGRYTGTWVAGRAASQVNVRSSASTTGLAEGETTVIGAVGENVSPKLSPNGVVNGASFAAGAPLAPGGILSAFGSNFAAGDFVATTVPLPASLGEVSALIGGQQAPLYYAGASQINAQAPFGLQPPVISQMVVRAGPRFTVPEPVVVADAQPGIFLLHSSIAGPDRAAAQNQDFSTNTPANPVQRGGAIIVYLTGQGAVDPAVPTGAAAPSAEPFARSTLPAQVTIGGRRADILFLGLSPGFVGLLQAVLVVPQDVAPGDSVPVSVSIGGQPSNTLMISVR